MDCVGPHDGGEHVEVTGVGEQTLVQSAVFWKLVCRANPELSYGLPGLKMLRVDGVHIPELNRSFLAQAAPQSGWELVGEALRKLPLRRNSLWADSLGRLSLMVVPRFIDLKRAGHVENGLVVLESNHSATREAPSIPRPLDLELDWTRRVPSSKEVGVEGVSEPVDSDRVIGGAEPLA
jgi:hypothetical protein